MSVTSAAATLWPIAPSGFFEVPSDGDTSIVYLLQPSHLIEHSFALFVTRDETRRTSVHHIAHISSGQTTAGAGRKLQYFRKVCIEGASVDEKIKA